MPDSRSCDVAVVGLGALGSATCWQLARRGVHVVGIDRHAPPHAHGSTHGDSRVTRAATAEGDAYVPLAQRSHELWRELEAATGSNLFTACGVAMAGPPTAGAGLHGVGDWVGATLQVARRHGIEHELLDGAAASARYPAFDLPADSRVFVEPGGGFVRPEAAVSAQLQLAAAAGAELRTGTVVVDLDSSSSGVRIRTDAGELQAAHVVLAAGAWVGDFVRDPQLRERFVVRRQLMHWFDLHPARVQVATPDVCPVFIFAYGERAEDSCYGFPALDGAGGGMKVASEQTTQSTRPDAVDRTIDPADARDLHDRVIAGRLTPITGRVLRSTTCLYTVTPDSRFLVDDHPEHASVTLASACSGHGFKHSAALGEAIAQRIVDGQSAIDLSAFSLGTGAPR